MCGARAFAPALGEQSCPVCIDNGRTRISVQVAGQKTCIVMDQPGERYSIAVEYLRA
jgi:hypothetical protein